MVFRHGDSSIFRLIGAAKGFWRLPTIQIAAGTMASVILSFGAVWFLGTSSSSVRNPVVISLLIVLLLLSYAVPLSVLTSAVWISFRSSLRGTAMLKMILVSYLSMTAVFAGVYYSMVFFGDHESAIWNYYYYQVAGERLAAKLIAHVNPIPEERAFDGIRERLWGTVDDSIPRGVFQGLEDVDQYRAYLAAARPVEDVVQFRRGAIPSVLSDCIYLSVTTITTVGFGNVAPTAWYAKLATSVEALTGTALLVVALGLAFSKK
jgi:hypothetical protein